MRVEWIKFKEKEILYSNFEGLTDEAEILSTLELQKKMMMQSTIPILLLVNLTGSPMTLESTPVAKEAVAAASARLSKIALVGITGLKTIIVKGFEKSKGVAPQRMFDTVAEAKEWLVS